MHKQKNITIEVDEKIHPLIQFINDSLPGLIPIASCQGGGDVEENESEDAYILLVVRSMDNLNSLMNICNVSCCTYNSPDPTLGNVPTYRLQIPDLDYALDYIGIIN